MENKEMLMETVEKSEGEAVSLLVERNGKERNLSVRPVFSVADGSYKIGAWVRDSIQGIGTVTYIDPNSGTFGALGHGVYDADTDMLMDIRGGSLTAAELTGIVKGQKGKAGELTGKIDLQEKIGAVEENTETGIFGTAEELFLAGEALPVANRNEIRKGKAEILSDLEGKGVCSYEIEIEGFGKKESRNHKDMTIRITDERLLRLTGGIVQGMSGSPIIQDGKLVGAVTYVLVNDPKRGYGIFIEDMLNAAG
jgi:stage IV sporulation protein B